jgi:hypothetical protein
MIIFSDGIVWRQKIDTQRGAVLATELKNNSCKLAKWTAQSIIAGAPLATLLVGRNALGDAGAALLARALRHRSPPPSLTHLDLSFNAIGPSGARALGRALATPGSRLRVLSLRINPVGDDGAAALAPALLAGLGELHLTRCRLGDAGARALGAALASEPGGSRMTLLDCRSNDVTPRGARWLQAGVEAHPAARLLLGAPLEASTREPPVVHEALDSSDLRQRWGELLI